MGARERLGELAQLPRVVKYRLLSDCPNVSAASAPTRHQPVLMLGPGSIALGRDVEFGWPTSSGFHTGYCHLEAATATAAIEIGDGAQINNNAMLKSEGPGIRIGAGALFGSDVIVYDSDFHDLRPDRRRDGRPGMAAVEIAENVFVGDRAIILKGARIGAGSAIGAGSVVTGEIPAGVIAAGNPARVISALPVDAKDRRADLVNRA